MIALRQAAAYLQEKRLLNILLYFPPYPQYSFMLTSQKCLQSLYCQKLQASVQILVMSDLTISLWHPSKDCLDIPIQLIRASVFYCSAKVAHVIGSWVCPGACDWVLILIGASHPQLPRGSAELQSENIFQLSLHIWTYQKARMTCLSIRIFFVFLQDLLRMP